MGSHPGVERGLTRPLRGGGRAMESFPDSRVRDLCAAKKHRSCH